MSFSSENFIARVVLRVTGDYHRLLEFLGHVVLSLFARHYGKLKVGSIEILNLSNALDYGIALLENGDTAPKIAQRDGEGRVFLSCWQWKGPSDTQIALFVLKGFRKSGPVGWEIYEAKWVANIITDPFCQHLCGID